MAKQRARRSSGPKSFCPVIRVKCTRKFSAARDSSMDVRGRKFAAFQAAKKRLIKRFSGLGNVHPHAEMTSLPPSAKKALVTKLAHAASNEAKCTVSMGGRSWKLKGAAAGQKVAELMRQQKAGGCCAPKVSRS